MAAAPRESSPAGYASPYRKVGGLLEVLPILIQLGFVLLALLLARTVFAAARLCFRNLFAPRLLIGAVMVLAPLGQWLRSTMSDSAQKRPVLQSKCASEVKTVAIIGAGPSGLVAAKFLSQRGYVVRVFESESGIGGTFRYRAYDGAVQVSSKYLTAFTDLRFSETAPDHVPLPEYLQYMEQYCDKFQLWQYLQFKTKVVDVSRRPGRGARASADYVVSVCGVDGKNELTQHEFDAVLICSGLHVTPLKPHIQGIEQFGGETIHSVDYKHRSQMQGKRILIIGSGETAMDIAYQGTLPKSATAVTLSHKNGFLSVPSCLPSGLPLDTHITNLFECSYEHRWVDKLRLKWVAATWGIRTAFWLFSGTSGGYNQWGGTKAEVKRGYHFINKSAKVLPAINYELKKSWRSFPWNLNQPEVDVPVRLVPLVSCFEDGCFHSVNNDVVEPDMVIFATGYRQQFPFLRNRSRDDTGDHILPSCRHILDPAEPHLAFIGFARPNVGAIPPISEMQIMWWLEYIAGNVQLPVREPTYCLLSSTSHKAHQYGVDHGGYVHQLARDIGAAPDLSWLVWHPRVFIAYILGQSYTTFFRLQGPYADVEQLEIARTELWHTVLSRGAATNFMFVMITALFGVLNAVCWLIDSSLSALGIILLPYASGHL